MLARSRLPSLFLLISSTAFAAEQPSADNGIPVDPAVHKLDVVTSRMTAYLKAVPTFRVETDTRWTLEGGTKAGTGGAHCELAVKHPNAFRLEIAARSEDQPMLVCASDGKTLTRFYHDGRLSLVARGAGGLDQLLDDAMTDESLKGSGLDLIMRRDAHQYLMASVSDVKDCGDEEIQGRPAHHFSTAWFGGSRVDFWIAADREPVLLRWKRALGLELGGKAFELQVDSELKWKTDAEFSADQAVVDVPKEAIEVQDLQAYLLKGGTDKLLGTPGPPVALNLLDGSTWDLAKHRGKNLVVLFFFATWATPSTQDMPAVLEFVRKYEGRGVVFYAVAVGEPPEAVRQFIDAQKYTHPVVLDPDQKAATAYRVTSLPVTVLIGKDGTVQSAHVGLSPEDRALIRQDMEQLVEGKQLVEPPSR